MNYHIITYGCQMNVNDSERIASFLNEKGLNYSSINSAQYVIINSCSIRQSTVDRIEAKIKELKSYGKTIILTGCVLEKEKEKLTSIIDQHWVLQNTSSWNLPDFKKNNKEFFEIKPKRLGVTAYISIMTGCNNFCSYCVVPYTKGREVSRHHSKVLNEIKEAINDGCREIFLLGQNVNSYKGEYSFANLLKEVDKINGDFWIKFATSHPKDFTDDIISVIKESKKIAKHIHLPLQSGDNDILRKMNRKYTVEHYKNIIKKIKEGINDISITTDIIVGFPGETENNFQNTVSAFQEIKFDMAYIARYSKRPQTTSEKFKETVSNLEKKEREKVLSEILKEIKLEKNKKKVGTITKVLVTGCNKKNYLIGKTEGGETIVLKGPKEIINTFVKVKIINYSPWGMKAKIFKK